ncbi:MAG: carbamate kinase [Nanoarchaeota archaeon]|nr:carbamate kinase [Nanoarchaeota archaeon]
MTGKKAVIALGGNAFLEKDQKGTFEEQIKNVNKGSKEIVKLIKKGWQVVITHGNGPQVGAILMQQDATKEVPEMPMYICGAESQGLMGYMLCESLGNELRKNGIKKDVVTFLTRVVVDKNDHAFKNPTKPVGSSYKTKNGLPKDWTVKETFRGFRRVVPSPDPKEIIEAETIKRTVPNAIVVACGGGGIPVFRKGKKILGVDAVIDKDKASELLARNIGADTLIILTDIKSLYLNWRKENEQKLGTITLQEAKKYYKEGHFLSGSMGPKIEASINFLENGGKRVVICLFEDLEKALEEKAGSMIKN